MCEHELKQALLDSVTRKELAAANARIAELEQELSQAKSWVKTMDETVADRKQRAEQAEAQCNQMEADCADFQAIIKRLREENAKRFNDNTAMYERMMGAEAQNKRMREALEEIASFDGWKSDIAKAALEVPDDLR